MSALNALDFSAFRRRRYWLKKKAEMAAAKKAKQYRNFLVGTAALVRPDNFRAYQTITSGNNYPVKGGARQCAEHVALQQLQLTRANLVIAFVTFGPPRPDDFSGISSPTLHPCGFCRWTALKSIRAGGPIGWDTIYLGINPEGVTEEFTYRQILEYHGVPTIQQLRDKRESDGASKGPTENELWRPDMFLKARRSLGFERADEAQKDWVKSFFSHID